MKIEKLVFKHRNLVAKDLFTNGLYKKKVEKDRKKILKKFNFKKEILYW